MSTTTIKTIGTAGGRDYSSVTAWVAACPLNLTTSISGGEIWQGEAYNDSEFLETVTVSGITVNATGYLFLTVAAGKSLFDVTTKPLNYNASLGAALRYNTFGAPLNIAIDYMRVSRLQVYLDASGVTDSAYKAAFGSENALIKDCLFKSRDNNKVVEVFGGKAVNCIAIAATTGTSGSGFVHNGGTQVFVNCTAVRPSDLQPVGRGFYYGGDSATTNNCASFGFTLGAEDGTFTTLLGDYNATDHASGTGGFVGAHSQHSLVYANQFQNTTLANAAFQLRSGSALIAAGNTDATNAPNDIFGTVRGSGTAGDIGAHEYTGVGPTGLAATWDATQFPKQMLRRAA